MEKVSIKIDPNVRNQLKIRAIHRGVQLQVLVDEYLKRMLQTRD